MWKRYGFFLFLSCDGGDGAGLAAHGIDDVLGYGCVDKAAFRIKARLGFGRFEGGREAADIILEACLEDKVVHGHEGLDLPIPLDDERERRRLDAAKREDSIGMAGFPTKDGHGAAGIHAYEPIRLRAGTGGIPEVGVVAVILECTQGLLDGARVKGGKPDTLDRAGVVEVFEDFIDEELAFPVRVSSVDYGGGLTKQMVDHLKLCVGFFFGAKFPFIGDNGEIAPAPCPEVIVIVLRIVLFEDMAKAPRHSIGAADLKSKVVLGDAEFSGYGPAE